MNILGSLKESGLKNFHDLKTAHHQHVALSLGSVAGGELCDVKMRASFCGALSLRLV